MPNFITSSIKNQPFISKSDDVSFGWTASGRNCDLLLTKSGSEQFFLILKKRDEKSFVVKAEKLTKPAKIGLLQRALSEFRDQNCIGVISEAIAVKKTHLTTQNSAIKDVVGVLELLSSKKWDKIFVEIGFGSGRHLLFLAEQNPDTLVLGIEVYKPSLEQVAKLAKVKNLSNIALVNTDARLLLSMFNSNSIDRVFLHFPVPWDDAPHRRVVSPSFVGEISRVLKQNASFELRSDSRLYADFCVANFMDLKSSNLQIYKNRNLTITSKYEDRWKRQNKDIYDVIFVCDEISDELVVEQNFDFESGYDTQSIVKNFKNFTQKFDDYFLHIEELFIKNDDEILLRVAFGAFERPEHCYVLVSKNHCEYFIKRPLLTKQNLKAHAALREYLVNAKNY